MRKIIEMTNVTKNFDANGEVIQALKNTTFSAEEGKLIAIIGPSGSGKSTFLTILGGLQTPTTGEVLIDGKPFSTLDVKQKSKVRFEKIGFILQNSNLVPFLTVEEQMTIYNKISKTKRNNDWFKSLLESLDVYKLIKKYPNELSGGERQRVAIAKALYHEPSVIFADEPTASLDTKRAFEVIKILSEQTKKYKKATILVTHDERLTDYCDEVYVMIDGVLTKKK
ncbi:ABC-type antimicrobial peptide transport system, ATPase component [Alteracholeplasma palmae J233]|uniref:Putative hemin import ATP-binding protein HrtA n=1 Tax=Alteracholeplasma palmae (strain ATCC 49389 / J233) TaxID=1318466 RepID=U4KKH3_ALTPJ|nr:ABC transporter ATP-binding protein [Alteracholeplasma palmae]CCV64234.1 ABC-type antimicrobial peptide transport system, ATPase component [Alteracholeplasma palmae J233]